MRNARLNEAQAGIKIARRNINNLRYVDGTTLMTKIENKLKNLLMKGKESGDLVSVRDQCFYRIVFLLE